MKKSAQLSLLGATLGIAVFVAPYGIEYMLEQEREITNTNLVALQKTTNRVYDTRAKTQVVKDLVVAGADAVASYSPIALVRLDINERASGVSTQPDPFPLAGIANKKTVVCNEMGPWLVIESDRHGFRNPDAIWDKPIDIVMVGDSFAFGVCVNRPFAEIIRERYPAMLNLGQSGSGSLAELGRVKEYIAAHQRPRVILWAFFENDLYETAMESNTVLRRYLEPGFSQNLVGRQREIENQLALFRATYRKKIDSLFWILHELRNRLLRSPILQSVAPSVVELLMPAITPAQKLGTMDFPKQLEIFSETMTEAKRFADSRKIKILFVYLPQTGWLTGSGKFFMDYERNRVLAVVGDLGIPIVDTLPIIMAAPNSKNLYAFDGAHFSPEGHELVGRSILAALDAMR